MRTASYILVVAGLLGASPSPGAQMAGGDEPTASPPEAIEIRAGAHARQAQPRRPARPAEAPRPPVPSPTPPPPPPAQPTSTGPHIELTVAAALPGGAVTGRVMGLASGEQFEVVCADEAGRVWARAPVERRGSSGPRPFRFTLRRAAGTRLEVRCIRGRRTVCSATLAYRPTERFGDRYELVAWLPDRALRPQEWERLREAGVTAVVASAAHAADPPGPLPIRHLASDLFAATALEWPPGRWRKVAAAYKATRSPDALGEAPALSDPRTRAKDAQRIHQRAARLSARWPAGYLPGLRCGLTPGGLPLDIGFRDSDLAHFATWSHRAGLETSPPLTFDAWRTSEAARPGRLDLSRWLVHRRFMQEAYIEALKERMAAAVAGARSAGQGSFRFFLAGPLLPDVHGFGDLPRLLPLLDGWLGGSGDLARAFARAFGRGGMTRVGGPVPAGGPAEDFRVGILEGDCGIVFAADLAGPSGGKRPDVGTPGDPPTWRAPRRDLASLPSGEDLWRWSGVARLLALCERTGGPVGVLYSAGTLRVSWALDARRDGASWLGRDPYRASALTNLRAWLALLGDLGVGYRMLDADEIARGTSDSLARGRLRVLILPRTLVVGRELAAHIDRFCRAGGTVIACSGVGLFDRLGRIQATAGSGGPLEATFGFRRGRPLPAGAGGRRLSEIDGRVLPVVKGEPRFRRRPAAGEGSAPDAVREAAALPRGSLAGLAIGEVGLERTVAAAAAVLEREPCLLIHHPGAGRAVLLNLTLSSYLWLRRQPTEATAGSGAVELGMAAMRGEDRGESIRRLVAHLLGLAGVRRPVEIRRGGRLTGTLRVVRYEAGPLEAIGLYDSRALKGLEGTGAAHVRFQAGPAGRAAVTYEAAGGGILGLGERARIRLDKRGLCPPRLITRLPYALRRIELEPEGPGRDGTFDVRLHAESPVRRWAPHVLAVRLRDPAGRVDPVNRTHVVIRGGAGRIALPLPLSAPEGLWTLAVRDVATGRRALRRFHVARP